MKHESRGVFLSERREIIESIKKRCKIVTSMRRYLDSKGIVEVETPILCTHREGGPFMQFETEHPVTSRKYFLSMCPEDRLKRVCSMFDEGIFEFSRCFRGEVESETHLSEFTMLEIKQPAKSVDQQIELAFGLIQYSVLETFGTLTPGKYDFRKFRIVSCDDALQEAIGFGIFDDKLIERSIKLLNKAGVNIKDKTSEWEILDNLIKYFVEPQMQELTFLVDFPLSLSTISRINKEKNTANRFQIMLKGIEIGDGGEKMTEAEEYRALYEDNMVYRRDILGITDHNDVCEEFIDDMKIANKIAGFGIGVDRFVSLLLGSNINDVILFPKSFNC